MKTLALVVFSLAVLVLFWLTARAWYRYRYAVGGCARHSASTDLGALGLLLLGAVIVLLNAILL